MDRNALDWLFSTAPQALAALVGLIFAGVSLFYSLIEKAAKDDETSADIYAEMRRTTHSRMKGVFWLAGISIVLDLVLIILNPIQNDIQFSLKGTFNFYFLVAGLVFLLNVITIILAICFVIRISRPDFYEEVLNKLSTEKNAGDIDAMDYLKKYIEFEGALRDLSGEMDSQYYKGRRDQREPTMVELINRLKWLNIADENEIKRMFQLNQLRNLIIHGGKIDHVERSAYEDVMKYTEKIRNYERANW